MIKETDKAWLAGIMDGEGCISLLRRHTYYVPSVKIANTNEKLIHRCKEILDMCGVVYSVTYFDRNERVNAKPSWTIVMESRPRVVAVLQLLEPYLISKNEQAKLVLDWCSKGKRQPTETKELFIDNIRKLNQRGRVK
jgi:hypothetical protein